MSRHVIAILAGLAVIGFLAFDMYRNRPPQYTVINPNLIQTFYPSRYEGMN